MRVGIEVHRSWTHVAMLASCIHLTRCRVRFVEVHENLNSLSEIAL